MKSFEILPYPACINFTEEQRNLLSVEARLYSLTPIDERKVRCCIEVATLTDGLVVMPAGINCNSLKDFVVSLGYSVSSCGNNFDLVFKV